MNNKTQQILVKKVIQIIKKLKIIQLKTSKNSYLIIIIIIKLNIIQFKKEIIPCIVLSNMCKIVGINVSVNTGLKRLCNLFVNWPENLIWSTGNDSTVPVAPSHFSTCLLSDLQLTYFECSKCVRLNSFLGGHSKALPKDPAVLRTSGRLPSPLPSCCVYS